MTAARIIAVAPNRSTAAPTVNDLKACTDTPASRRQKNIRATSAATAIVSQWAAATNIATAVNRAAITAAVVARDTGVAAGKTNTTNAAVMAIPWAAPASNVATTNRATTTRNDTTIRAAIVPAKDTKMITTTTAIATDVAATQDAATMKIAAATKDAAGGTARQMKSHRGLVTTKHSAGVAWTNNATSANIADAYQKAIAALMNASRKTSTIA